MKFSWKAFGILLGHAAAGGAATGLAQYLGQGGSFSGSSLGVVAAASALTSVISLLASNPFVQKPTIPQAGTNAVNPPTTETTK